MKGGFEGIRFAMQFPGKLRYVLEKGTHNWGERNMYINYAGRKWTWPLITSGN